MYIFYVAYVDLNIFIALRGGTVSRAGIIIKGWNICVYV